MIRSRRRTLAAIGLAAAAPLAGCAARLRGPERGPIAGAFPGRIDDGGFIESGYRGLRAVESELKIPVRYVDGIANDPQAMRAALRELAKSDATMIVALGGQMSAVAREVSWEFPEQRFTVVQGDAKLMRPNLGVYEALQEQSTWLAGALAGMLTKSNVVGHMSGIRVPPGLRARAAFAAGLAAANPKARLLTNFSGSQDDAALARRVALAQIDAGADIVYTMLNAGRSGAIEACRQRGVKQIGNARDWVESTPDVFVGSAISDAGAVIVQAVRDLVDSVWRGDLVRSFGLREPRIVRLSLAASVPQAARTALEDYRTQIIAGRITMPERYEGPEFDPPA